MIEMSRMIDKALRFAQSGKFELFKAAEALVTEQGDQVLFRKVIMIMQNRLQS